MQRLSSKERAQDVRLSRREFVAALAVPLVAGACNRRPYRRSDFSLPQRSVVELLPASSYDVDFGDLIGRGLRDLGVTVRGRRVLLKPNMVEYEPGTAINTNPLVVAGAIAAFQRAGAAEVVVAEGPGHRRDTEYLLTRTGLYDHLRDHRRPVRRPQRGRRRIRAPEEQFHGARPARLAGFRCSGLTSSYRCPS